LVTRLPGFTNTAGVYQRRFTNPHGFTNTAQPYEHRTALATPRGFTNTGQRDWQSRAGWHPAPQSENGQKFMTQSQSESET